MAYNTKNILRSGDASPIPIPQFYNPTEDAFNPLTGANLGSGRYGADGVMWGKTAGGVYIPVQVNANGEVLTQLSGRNVEVKKTTLNVSSTIVEPGQTVFFEFVVPPKELWTIQEIECVIIGIPDSTGTHTMIIQYDMPGTSSGGLQLAKNESLSSTKNLTYRFGEFETAGTDVKPTDKAASALAVKGKKMTSNFVVYFRYINSSNKAHNGLKAFVLAYEKEVMS